MLTMPQTSPGKLGVTEVVSSAQNSSTLRFIMVYDL